MLVHAAGRVAALAVPPRRLLQFAFFGGGAIAAPLFFFAAGWSACRWQSHAGGGQLMQAVLRRALAAVGWSALICSPLLASQPARRAFLEVLPVLGLLVLLSLAALTLRRFRFVDAVGTLLSPLVGRPGGLILLSLPTAAILFMTNWHALRPATSLLVDYPLLIIYTTWFAAGWWIGSSPALFDKLTRRWRFRLILAFLLSFVLYGAHLRYNAAGLIEGPRRMLFCLTYVMFTWRAILALAGAYRVGRLRVPNKLLRPAEALFCCYCIHRPWIAWFEQKLVRPEVPVPLQFLAISAGTLAIAWAGYELVVRRTPLRAWLAWGPTAGPFPG